MRHRHNYIHGCAHVCVNGSGRVSFFFLYSYSRGGVGSVGPRSFGTGSRHRVHQVDFISKQLPTGFPLRIPHSCHPLCLSLSPAVAALALTWHDLN